MDVTPAETEWELAQVRRLFRSFLEWHRLRHAEDLALVEAYFDQDAWERELSGLPGEYAPPDGRLLVAWEADLAAGCAAMRRLDADTCEMKRLFVAPTARGAGVGRALVVELLAQARQEGYRAMYLDTSIRQSEAIALYRSLGFEQVEPYHDVSADLRDWLVFFRLAL